MTQFGDTVGLYFHFLSFYTKHLVFISATGVLFYFFKQRRRGAREAKAAALASHEMGGLDAKYEPYSSAGGSVSRRRLPLVRFATPPTAKRAAVPSDSNIEI